MMIAFRSEYEGDCGISDLYDFLRDVLDVEDEDYLQDYLAAYDSKGRGYVSLPLLGDVRYIDIFKMFQEYDGHSLDDLVDAMLDDEYDYWESEIMWDDTPTFIHEFEMIAITDDEVDGYAGVEDPVAYVKELLKKREED